MMPSNPILAVISSQLNDRPSFATPASFIDELVCSMPAEGLLEAANHIRAVRALHPDSSTPEAKAAMLKATEGVLEIVRKYGTEVKYPVALFPRVHVEKYLKQLKETHGDRLRQPEPAVPDGRDLQAADGRAESAA